MEVAYHYFYYMLLVTQTNSGTAWEGTAQRGEYQGSLGTTLEADCHMAVLGLYASGLISVS